MPASLSYVLLGAAMVALWWPALAWRGRRIALWPPLFASSLGCALALGDLRLPGLLGVVLLGAVAALAQAGRASPRVPGIATVLGGGIALLFALHLWPGFQRYTVFGPAILSHAGQAFALHANYDTGVAGLLLAAGWCRRGQGRVFLQALRRALLPALAATLGVLLLAALLSE